MFKNRSIQMKLVKSTKLEDQKTVNNYNHYTLPSAKKVAVAAGALYTLKRVLDTTSVIAINKFVK